LIWFQLRIRLAVFVPASFFGLKEFRGRDRNGLEIPFRLAAVNMRRDLT
jgi:hypothetical protein